jgi:peptidoglycan hydrolase-like protein with peptidoglycan-binding domain
MLSTSQLREAWAPACSGPLSVVEFVQGVRVKVHSGTESAVRALGRVLQAHGYVVRKGDTGAFNCRPITGGSGYSLHAYGIAIDVNWNTNPFRKDNKLVTDMPAAMVKAILAIRTANGKQVWGWGGNYRSVKDAMHYEIVCRPSDLATGIDWSTVDQPELVEERPVQWPLVRRGDRGPAVEELHRRLGVVQPGGPGFGTFGPMTEAAVREYQRTRGLTVDGVVGMQTWTAILTDQPEVDPDEPGPVKRLSSDSGL